MTVLHVGKFYPPAPGGMEKVVQLLCEGERRTIDSRVLVANHGTGTIEEVVGGVPVTRVRSLGTIGSVGVCPAFPVHLARIRRDLTVIHEPNPLALVSDFVARQRGPLVVWFHSEVLRPAWKYRTIYRTFLRRVLRRADRIVISSPRLGEYATELQDFREKCVVIPFGIDPAALALTPAIEARAAAMRAQHPGPIALFVGRLVPYKGVNILLEALKGLNLTTLIVGTGPLRQALEEQAGELGLQSSVRFLGAAHDHELVALYHACDFLVLPSVTRAETFGVVQLEAMACSRPVISTNLETGVPWVNQHEVTGLVVQPGDVAGLAAACWRLCSDSALRKRLGAGAAARVAAQFTVSAMAQATTALYLETCANSGRSDS